MSVTTFASPAARPIMLAMTVLLASGCASNPPPVIDSAGCIATPDYVVNDPAESVNRSIFVVNRALDDYLLGHGLQVRYTRSKQDFIPKTLLGIDDYPGILLPFPLRQAKITLTAMFSTP